MKKYQASEDLETIFLSNGLICTSNEEELDRGKKTFKLNPTSRKFIRLDHLTITAGNSTAQLEDFIYLEEDDLRAIILFLKLDKYHLSELGFANTFESSKVKERIRVIRKGLERFERKGVQVERQTKLRVIMDTWNSVII